MKGKFSSIEAECMYSAWMDGLYEDDYGTAERWYVLFRDWDGKDFILTEDTQGFVDVAEYPKGEGAAALEHIMSTTEEYVDEDGYGSIKVVTK